MVSEERLIDANDAEKFAMGYLPAKEKFLILDFLRECPTVDAVPVVHGPWNSRPIHKFNSKGKLIKYCDLYHCSKCGADRPIVPPYNYCPNCGAKMDQERRTQ